jgi:hypothetical protein
LWQAYSKRFYEEKLKEVIQARWNVEYKAKNPDHNEGTPIPLPSLAFRNEAIRSMYEEESEEIKKEIEAYRDKLGNDDDSDAIDEEGISPEERERRKVATTYQS